MDYYEAPKTEYVYYINEEEIKDDIRSDYGDVADAKDSGGCCGNERSCCGVGTGLNDEYALELGYTQEDLDSLPDEIKMTLGCGNPQSLAGITEGETVLDLGAGAGVDVFLASKKVGESGKVYGVDMTPSMLKKSRTAAKKYGFNNVEFLLGEIEHLPLPNNVVDVIMSNCVINLSTNKEAVFYEAFRVLKEGGRLAVSDIVAFKPLPEEMVKNRELYSNCISGAMPIADLQIVLERAGFVDIMIELQEESRMFIRDWVPGSDSENYVISAKIKARKPIFSL